MILEFLSTLSDAQFVTLLFVLGLTIVGSISIVVGTLTGWR